MDGRPMTGDTVVTSGTLLTTDSAAKQILLHINALRIEAIIQARGKGYDTMDMKQEFIMRDLDDERILVKTELLEGIREDFQLQLEQFNFNPNEKDAQARNNQEENSSDDGQPGSAAQAGDAYGDEDVDMEYDEPSGAGAKSRGGARGGRGRGRGRGRGGTRGK